jgi:hypothetical protein
MNDIIEQECWLYYGEQDFLKDLPIEKQLQLHTALIKILCDMILELPLSEMQNNVELFSVLIETTNNMDELVSKEL